MKRLTDWYIIDEDGLEALVYCLKEEYAGKTVLILVEEEQIKKEELNGYI